MEYHDTAKAALTKGLEEAIKLTKISDPDQVFRREVTEAERKRKDIQASYSSATRAERDIIHRKCGEAEDAEAALRENWAKTGPQKKAQYNAQRLATHDILMDHIAKVAEHVPDAELQKRFGFQWTLHVSSLSPPGSCFDEETTIGDARQPQNNSTRDISKTAREVFAASGTSTSNSHTPDPDLQVPVPQQEIPFVELENPNGSVRRDSKSKRLGDHDDGGPAAKKSRRTGIWQPESSLPIYKGLRSTAIDEIDYSDVWADGNPAYPCMICHCLDSESRDVFYILRCDEHGVTFSEGARQGAAKHLRSRDHGYAEGNSQTAYDRLSIRVLNCTTYLQMQNNDMFKRRVKEGFQPAKSSAPAKELIALYKACRGLAPIESCSSPTPFEDDEVMTELEQTNSAKPRQRHNKNHALEVVPGEVYQGWETSTWRPVVALPSGSLESIGLKGTLEDTGILEKLADYAAVYDPMAGEFYRNETDQEGTIRTRLYPVMRFDGNPSFPEESTVSLLELENLQNFDVTNSALNKDYYSQEALKYLAIKGKKVGTTVEASDSTDLENTKPASANSAVAEAAPIDASTDERDATEPETARAVNSQSTPDAPVTPSAPIENSRCPKAATVAPAPASECKTTESRSSSETSASSSAQQIGTRASSQQTQEIPPGPPGSPQVGKEARDLETGLASIQAQAFGKSHETSPKSQNAIEPPQAHGQRQSRWDADADDGNSSSGSDKIIVQPLLLRSPRPTTHPTTQNIPQGPRGRNDAHRRPQNRPPYHLPRGSGQQAIVGPRKFKTFPSTSPLRPMKRDPPPSKYTPESPYGKLRPQQKHELRLSVSERAKNARDGSVLQNTSTSGLERDRLNHFDEVDARAQSTS